MERVGRGKKASSLRLCVCVYFLSFVFFFCFVLFLSRSDSSNITAECSGNSSEFGVLLRFIRLGGGKGKERNRVVVLHKATRQRERKK